MANFCDFEFRVRGKKKAVKAFYESTPYLDWKEAEYEGGTDSNYEMHFKGNCKWSINFDVEDDCDGVTVDLSKHSISQIEELGSEYVGYSVRAKSEIFQCEVKVHYWSMESEFDQFDHYKNGECLKKRKIAFDNYGEEENFDWDTLEFIGHEGEYDESVDGEQSDIDLMNMLRMMPGVSVPSQKPKKKVNSSVGVTSSSKKATTPFKGIKITRDKNNVVKGKGYTYVVPDGFRVGKEDGRDFIAWLPSSSSNGIDDAKIRIYPPNKNMQFGNGEEGLGGLLEYFQKSPLLCDAYQDYMCQLTKTQNPLGFKLNYEYFPTVLSHTSGGCMYNRTSGYYTFLVKVLIGDHFEQFRFDVVGVTASNEGAAQDLVRELADGIIPNKSFNLPEPLNGEKYRSATLTAGVVKEWSENFNSQLGLQAAVRNIRQKAIEEKIKFMASEGDIDRDIIVDDIRRMSREYLDVVVKLVEEAIDIIGFFSRQGANKAQVTKLRNETVEYLDNNNEISVNLDGEAIREEIKQLRDLKDRIAHAEDFNSTVSSQKTPIEKSIPKETKTYSEPKSEIGNDELDAKILDLLKNGEKYAVKELRTGDEIIESLSPQRLSAALRRMTQDGSLIKVDENGDSFYYSVKALYDKTVKAFNGAKTVEKYEELIKTFNLLGGHQDARAYVEKCREQIKEINYDAANKLMLSAKTPNDFKKAADAFKKLGTFRESEANLTLCNTKKQELENSNAYDSAIKKMNDAKSSAELSKVVSLFEALGAYRDSKELVAKCKEKASVLKEEERKQSIYNQAIAKIASSDVAILTQAATELDTISGWRDADIQAHRVRTKISDLLIEEERVRIAKEKKKKKIKVTALIVISVLVIGVILAILTQYLFIPMHKMNKAEELLASGNYLEAKELYEELDGYSNSGEQIKVIDGLERVKDGDFEEGINAILSNGVPVEITYELGGGGFSQTQTLMLGYTLSTDPSIVPLSTVESVNTLSNENNVFLFTSKSEFDGLYVPNRNGYSFVEYKLENHRYDLSEGNNCVRLTLTAQWAIETYGVTYELDGGKVNKENIIVYNVEDDSISLNAPIRDGYTFVGWIGTDLNEPTKDVKIQKGSYGDRHYIATWKANEYLVTFDANQGVCDCLSANVLFDSEVQLPIPTREGYTFIGWYHNSQKFEDGIWKHLDNVSLTAEWKITEYSITYHLDGGENAPSNPSVFTANDEVVLEEPSRTGYTFVGWTFEGQTEPTKNVKISLGTKVNKEYTAHWQANTYHITFNPNGGSSSTLSMDMTYDTNYTLPTPTKTGYTFLGWYSGSTKYTSGISKISDNIELLAKWEAKSYTITYNPNGGMVSSTTQTVTYGTAYTLHTPTRAGYTFEGWYSGSSEIFSGTWNKDSGITVTAQWKVITYTITYENTYGTPNSNPITYTVNDEITLANLNLTGNPFVGWYNNSSYTTPITKISKGTTGNITLYAKFTYAYEPIYNASDLKSIQMGKSYILMNNIDLGGAEWTPLGSYSAPFTGSFNGNGYKISNFKISSTTNQYVGLFGYCKGSIANLGVENFTINVSSSASTYAGGLVGYNYGGTISNCYASGNVTVTYNNSTDYKNCYAGGLVGYNYGGLIIDSYANCTVNAVTNSGFNDSYAGGLVAYNSSSGYKIEAGTIENCYTLGTVFSNTTHTTSEAYAGGLIAYNGGNVTNCYTNITVTAYSLEGYYGGHSYAGGLIGYANKGEISNCYTMGATTAKSSDGYECGDSYSGGLIGVVSSNVIVKNCYAVGSVSAQVSAVYESSNVYIGGLFGSVSSSATTTNCYRLSTQTISPSNNTGGSTKTNTTGTAKTQAQIQTTSFHTSTLGWSTSIWNIISNAYPTLK